MLTEDFDPLKGKMFQVLDNEGNANPDLEPKLTDAELIRAYETMVLTRLADDKAVRLQRQGRLGAYPPSKGQEASQIGPAMVLRDSDWLVWAFRELGALLLKGAPLWRVYLYWMGNEEGSNLPEATRITPSAVPVGTHLQHASGMGFASKYFNDKSVVLCYFGDGATSEGDFHEALNLAGVFKTPNIFVCQNNQYAISVPRSHQCAARTLAQKAVGYGLPGIQVDGNDLLALYAAAREAEERARRGDGPTLIESFTYRMGDHTTSDDATRYRYEAELKQWAEKDPIKRLRLYMEKRGIWDAEKERRVQEEGAKTVEEAVAQAESYPLPSLDEVFRHTYAEMTEELREQLEFYRKDLGLGGGE